MAITPAFRLPNDPSSLQQLVHTEYLHTLRGTYEHNIQQFMAQIEDDQRLIAAGRRPRRKRRNSEDELFPSLGSTNPPSTKIDSAHVYDLVYTLSPAADSDAFYHGPNPPPHPKIVKTTIGAWKKAKLIDPDDLTTSQLARLADPIWAGQGWTVHENPHPTQQVQQNQLQQQPQKQLDIDWEESVIASFSTHCDAVIGKSLANLPYHKRPVYTSVPIPAGVIPMHPPSPANVPPPIASAAAPPPPTNANPNANFQTPTAVPRQFSYLPSQHLHPPTIPHLHQNQPAAHPVQSHLSQGSQNIPRQASPPAGAGPIGPPPSAATTGQWRTSIPMFAQFPVNVGGSTASNGSIEKPSRP